ncbi:hypothetical protein V1525DRAFT_392527 [Lipomyces kononenkoae]|uniref:Uncharacterized protein n=1 Tax=Lipomyces kononenkoae TaxID=34357 RepID=A0ACC3TC67_LIPKO
MKKALVRRLRPSLSALASPLAGFDEFYIVLDEPHRVWTPGDSVSGVVVLDLPKPVRTAQIRLRLLGQLTIRNPVVKGPSFRHVLCHEEIVLWDAGERDKADIVDLEREATVVAGTSTETRVPVSAQNGSRISPAQSIDSIETARHGRRDKLLGCISRHANISLSTSSVPSDGPAARKLPKGEHTFAFMFELPAKGLMTSLEFEKGSIVYMLTASHHRPGPFPPMTCHKVLSLQCPLDIADLPPPKPSMLSVEIKKKNRRHERGTATAIVETPSVGCLRGQVIPVKITVRHVREVRSVNGVVITFLRLSRVCAQDLDPLSFRKDLVQTVTPLYIDSRTLTTTIAANIRVPMDIFPTIDEYPLVAFKYCLEVVLDLSGKAELPLAQTVMHGATTDPAPNLESRPYVDTEQLKRMKGVVSLWTEIVVGTDKSEHIKSNTAPAKVPANSTVPQSIPVTQRTSRIVTSAELETPQVHASSSTQPIVLEYPSSEYSSQPPAAPLMSPQPTLSNDSRTIPPAAPLPEPTEDLLRPPPLPHIDQLPTTAESEKERLALLEEALLPSAPPEASSLQLDLAVPTIDELEIDTVDSAGSSSYSAAARAMDKLDQERQRLEQLESAPQIPSDRILPEDDAAPVYTPTAPARHHIEAYVDDQDVSGSDSSSEVDDGDWVPMYSPNAEEEQLSLGGYHHHELGYPNSYGIDDTTNAIYEHSPSSESYAERAVPRTSAPISGA